MFNNIQTVNAHCDVPCGIYDPSAAIISALSVIRMIDLMDEKTQNKPENEAQYLNDMARYITVKEQEAIKCKEEIRIIWGDFIKTPHLEEYPEIHQIVHNIMAKGGAAKQHASRAKAMELLEEVNKFAEIFWAIKGVEIKRVKAPYAPNEEVVYPILQMILKLFKIQGDSLYPLYKDGQRVLCIKLFKFNKLNINDIVVFEKQNYGLMIKQIKSIEQHNIYVEGTDSLSIDSRNFGSIKKEEIKYKVLF